MILRACAQLISEHSTNPSRLISSPRFTIDVLKLVVVPECLLRGLTAETLSGFRVKPNTVEGGYSVKGEISRKLFNLLRYSIDDSLSSMICLVMVKYLPLVMSFSKR